MPSVAAYLHAHVTNAINAAAIEVHKKLGPGFLESIDEEAMCVELDRRKIAYQRQLPVRVRYDGVPVGLYRLDHAKTIQSIGSRTRWRHSCLTD